MFDIGGFEILIIIIVVVVLVKPEDMPKLLNDVGRFLKKIKNHIITAKEQINQIINQDEIKNFKQESIKNIEEINEEIRKIKEKAYKNQGKSHTNSIKNSNKISKRNNKNANNAKKTKKQNKK